MSIPHSFEQGFNLTNTYGATREFSHGLTDEQRQDLYVDTREPFIYGSVALADAAWDMANYGDEAALTLLGIAAREDVPRNSHDYQAVPGYQDAVVMPKSSRRQPKTVFDFEREMLELEQQRYDVLIRLPAATALRVAKRAENTPFDAV